MNRRIRLDQGDDLRGVALREFGDPTRWGEIATLNDLRLPFIVPSWRQEDRLPHTLIWGDSVLLPLESRTVVESSLTTFGADLALPGGSLATSGGDLALISGDENLVQALSHRIKTARGELTHHWRYGCHVGLAVGLPTAPFASLMASAWVYEALREEPRLSSIVGVDARVDGDSVRVLARVVTTDQNSPIDLNLVLNP